MPATSVAQQEFMGAILSGDAKKPKSMTMKQVREFAATPRKDLPEHIGRYKSPGHDKK